MMLLCDVGNTRFKWAYASEDGRLLEWGAVEHRSGGAGATFDTSLSSIVAVKRVVACSVAAPAVNASLEAYVYRRWSVTPEWMSAYPRGWGVECAYRAPETMGADRWAMLVAIRRRCPRGACVVSCGTAVTIDLIDARGRHLGGVIMPGVGLMRRALTANAALIAPTEGEVRLLPDNTPDAVATGTVLAAASTADRLFREFVESTGPGAQCVLCGGDAEGVRVLMTHETVVAPRLVLEGLAIMACDPP